MHLLTHQIVVKNPLICQTDSGDSLLLKPHPLPKKRNSKITEDLLEGKPIAKKGQSVPNSKSKGDPKE